MGNIVANDMVCLGYKYPEHLDNANQANDGEQINDRLSQQEVGNRQQKFTGKGDHHFHLKRPPIIRKMQ